MTVKKRNEEIDFLRGFAIILMIFLHSAIYFPSNKFAYTLWDYGHFVVPILIFTSSYVFFKKTKFWESSQFPSYLKKRILRLLVPYYIFLVIYFILVGIKEPSKINFQYIFSNITLTEGIDINWIVLLFVYLSFLDPFLLFLRKNKFFFGLTVIFVFVSTLVPLFYSLPISYKLFMWAPWLSISIGSFYVVNFERNRWFTVTVSILSFLLFLAARFFQKAYHHSLLFYHNKYPPNIYYLAYGIFWINLLLLLFRKFLRHSPVKKIFDFFSYYSYSIFFIHYLVIYVVTKFFDYRKLNWCSFFLLVLFLSASIQRLINRLSSFKSYLYLIRPSAKVSTTDDRANLQK